MSSEQFDAGDAGNGGDIQETIFFVMTETLRAGGWAHTGDCLSAAGFPL